MDDEQTADEGNVIGTLAAVRGLEKTSQPFRRELLAMCKRLRIDADALAAVMSFETMGTFSPKILNLARSGAVGLIQFTRGTAERLGTTTQELSTMSATAQLAYVEKYLAPAAGRLDTVADHYMAVFAPKGIGEPSDFALYSKPSQAYDMNAGLDRDKDGVISKGEASAHVVELLEDAAARPRLPVHGGGAAVAATVVLMAVAAGAWLYRG